MNSSSDRNLLFGALAVQLDFITEEQLTAGMQAWRANHAPSLADQLANAGWLSASHRQVLEPLVDAHIQRHGNDPQQSLAAVERFGTVTEQFSHLHDTHLQAAARDQHPRPEAAKDDARPTLQPTTVQTARNAEIKRDAGGATLTLPKGVSAVLGMRYRILREHAEGGLGKVYVARDEEVGREVALKEIKFEHANDLGFRARFMLEAEVTGGLEHPGVVPVYGLGTYADGRPYYAMRFIKGDSLKQAIDRFHRAETDAKRDGSQRNVELRNLLNRFIAVCEAVSYAHSKGVLHRDLKPANVMLGPFGETLVVDWGLAKVKGQSEKSFAHESEVALRPASGSAIDATAMGSTIGTLQYMSPEQFQGRLDLLGPAADVFSLGATLYDILTGRPPYPEKERTELLRKVEAAEFKRPTDVKRSIPPAIQSICLRAMAKEPQGRYQTPKALALDLERWLADEPVEAHPESRFERTARWARKNRPLVRTGAVALVAIAIVSLTALAFVLQAHGEARRAEAQAEDLFIVAHNAVDRWTTGAGKLLEFAPGLAQAREQLLVAAAGDYERLSAARTTDPELELERGRAQLRLGEVERELGKIEQAEKIFTDAAKYFEQLAVRFPVVADQALVEHGRALNRQGAILALSGDSRSLELWKATIERLKQSLPSAAVEQDRRNVVGSAHLSAAEHFASINQLSEARENAGIVLELLPIAPRARIAGNTPGDDTALRLRMGALQLRARMNAAEGHWTDARIDLAIASEDGRQFQRPEQFDPAGMLTVAGIHVDVASVCRTLGLTDKELGAYGDALNIYRDLARVFPDSADQQEMVALTLADRAQFWAELQNLPGAQADIREALAIATNLAGNFPQVLRYQEEQAAALETQGRLLRDHAHFSAARSALEAALKILNSLAASRPDAPAYRQRAAAVRTQLARVLAAEGQMEQAEALFKESLAELDALAASAPESPALRRDIAWLHDHWGTLLWEQDSAEAAEIHLRQAAQAWSEIVTKWPIVEYELAYANLLANCVFPELRQAELAGRLARRASGTSPENPLARSALAIAHYRSGRFDEAAELLTTANENGSLLPRDCFIQAMVLQAAGKHRDAQRAFDEAVARQRMRAGDEALGRISLEAASFLGVHAPSR